MVALMALLMSACRPEAKPEVKPPLVGWRPVGTWSGRGNTQTESFNNDSGQFRIKWVTRNEASPGAGKFRVEVHSAVSGRFLSQAVDHQGVGHDTAYFSDDPRLYHLVIESSDIDWWVAVEEAIVQ